MLANSYIAQRKDDLNCVLVKATSKFYLILRYSIITKKITTTFLIGSYSVIQPYLSSSTEYD